MTTDTPASAPPTEFGIEWSMVAHRINSAIPLDDLDEETRRSVINVAYAIDNAYDDGRNAALAEKAAEVARLKAEARTLRNYEINLEDKLTRLRSPTATEEDQEAGRHLAYWARNVNTAEAEQFISCHIATARTQGEQHIATLRQERDEARAEVKRLRELFEATRAEAVAATEEDRVAIAACLEQRAIHIRDNGPKSSEGLLTALAGAQVGCLLDAAQAIRALPEGRTQGEREERERLQPEIDRLTTMADAAEEMYWALNRASLDTTGSRARVFDALRLLGRYPPPKRAAPEPREEKL